MTEPDEIAARPDPPDPGLRAKAIESARWVMIGRVINEGGSFIGLILLSRLLTPSQVGLSALAMVFAALSSSILSGGFGSPLIKFEHISDAHVEVAGFMSIVSGLLLTVICLLLSRLLIGVVGRESADLLALVSPVFLLNSMAVVPQSLRSRHLEFRRLMEIEAISGTVATVSAVAFAAVGAGAASLVLAMLATGVAIVALSVPGSHARWPRWRRAEAKSIFSFGWSTSLSMLLSTATRNIDYAILSGRLPSADVGFYYRAYTLVFDYQMKFSRIMTRIMFPLLSRADPAKTEMVRSRVIRLHAIVLFPCLAYLAVTAPELVPLLLGDQWADAVVPVQILSLGGLALAIGTGIGPAMMAAGHPRALLINNLISFIAFAATVFVCSAHGLTVICIGVAIYRLLSLVISQYMLGTRILGIPLRRTLIDDPGPAFVSSLAIVALGIPSVYGVEALGPAAVVCFVAASGFGAYALALRLLFPEAWSDLTMVVGGLVPARITRRLSAAMPSKSPVG